MRTSHFRREVERLMLDRCRISDPAAGEPVVDRNTLTASASAGAVIYEGRCQVASRAGRRGSGEGAAAQTQTDELTLKVPLGVDGLAVGQRVVLTRHAVPDVEWSDADWTVLRVEVSTMAVSRSLILERIVYEPTLAGSGT